MNKTVPSSTYSGRYKVKIKCNKDETTLNLGIDHSHVLNYRRSEQLGHLPEFTEQMELKMRLELECFYQKKR